jgi:hypothetical protein
MQVMEKIRAEKTPILLPVAEWRSAITAISLVQVADRED